jgi:hypothetical protein
MCWVMASNRIHSLYLDVCLLCRPFDDQQQMRIRLETDAYKLIRQSIQEQRYPLLRSPCSTPGAR